MTPSSGKGKMTNQEILERVKKLENQILKEILYLQENRMFNFTLEDIRKEITTLRKEIENDGN